MPHKYHHSPTSSSERMIKRLQSELFDKVTYRIYSMHKNSEKGKMIFFIDFYPSSHQTLCAKTYVVNPNDPKAAIDLGEISSKKYSVQATYVNAHENLKLALEKGTFLPNNISSWIYTLHNVEILGQYNRVRVKYFAKDGRTFRIYWLIDLGVPNFFIFFVPSVGHLITVNHSFPEDNADQIKEAFKAAAHAYEQFVALDKNGDSGVFLICDNYERVPIKVVYEKAGHFEPPDGQLRPEHVYQMG